MNLDSLYSVSPIDGRYFEQTKLLRNYFSEYALIKYRIKTEIEYFIALCEFQIPELYKIDKEEYQKLRKIYLKFDEKSAIRVKEIESTTNHDVKAIEYFIKEKFDEYNLSDYKEFIHFGLTSQDINNTAIPASIKDFVEEVYKPSLNTLLVNILERAKEWKDIPMLARTHGQPATPTRLGKEIKVFYARILEQLKQLENIPYSAKFGGATGNFNAHYVAYSKYDWKTFGDNFVNKYLGLNRSYPTTQIEHYDNIAALMQCVGRINTILIDFCRDMWAYISIDYFKQKIKENEVGSSAMPHKVNPIDFENAEGNFGYAIAIGEFLANKLPISRLQRDLTDSTALRNIGMPFAHTMIGFTSITKGLSKLLLKEEKIRQDLEDNWIVIAEAIQTILRREKYPDPYEALKALTRTNEKINHNTFIEFIDTLEVSDDIKSELKAITPFNYIGQ